MPHYLVQGGYAPETWARLMRSPEDREAAVRGQVDKVGGKLETLYFSFGQDDFVAIVDMPDNASAAALAVAVASTGAYRNFRTTPLITNQEMTEVTRRAGQIQWRAPGV